MIQESIIIMQKFQTITLMNTKFIGSNCLHLEWWKIIFSIHSYFNFRRKNSDYDHTL